MRCWGKAYLSTEKATQKSFFIAEAFVNSAYRICFVIEHVKPDIYTTWPGPSLPNDLRNTILQVMSRVDKIHKLLRQ